MDCCFGTKPAYQVHHVDEDDDGREHSGPGILGVTQDEACHAMPCRAVRPRSRPAGPKRQIVQRECEARRNPPAAAPAHSGRLV